MNLEHKRAEPVTLEILLIHLASINDLMEANDITEPDEVSNLDGTGISMRGMKFGRANCLAQNGTRGNTLELRWRGTCDHVTVMPIISASGLIFTPLFVLPGSEARRRKRGNGKYETPSDFLPKPDYLFMQTVAVVNTNIFSEWAVHFVQE